MTEVSYFKLSEFLRSETADALGDPNTPTKAHLANLNSITIPGFNKARVILGCPVTITSGYRNPRVNKAVGGVSNSDHAMGLAGDGRTTAMSVYEAATKLAASDLVFDQLIYEKSRDVFHLGFGTRMRRQVLTQPLGAGTPFHVGIIR